MEKKALPAELRLGRVTLRVHDLAQADAMFALVDEDRARLRRFLPWVDGSRTADDTRIYIELTHAQRESLEVFDYSIFAEGAYVGNIGAHSLAWTHERCELGYWIAGAYEGRGYVSEAVRALEAACFAAGFHRVEIRCNADNARSAGVPRRLGYTLEGTLREDSMEMGRRSTTLVFAKLAGDAGT